MINISYDTKANLTTILTTYLIPTLVGLGCSEATSSAFVGLLVTGIIIGLNMLSEMYTSRHLTVDRSDDETIEDDENVGLSEIIFEESPIMETSPSNLETIEIGGQWMIDKTLQHHEDVLDVHDEKLDKLQNDITKMKNDTSDIKTRLGIKDITNGQVLKYYDDLVEAQEREREERKEQDNFIHQRLDKIDSRTWAILVGIIILFLGEIVQAIVL